MEPTTRSHFLPTFYSRYGSILTTILSLGAFGLILPTIHDHFLPTAVNHQVLHRRAGDETAASDLYGIGIRVGIYAQATGMLLSASCFRVGGIKLSCCASMLGLLASWTVLASGQRFSACEAFIVISLISVISIPASIVSPIPDDEGGVGGIVLCLANLWVVGINFWFWLSLYNQLPLLGTRDLIFFFAKVSVKGWIRKVMIVSDVFLAFGALRSIFLLVPWEIKEKLAAYHGVSLVKQEERDEELLEKMKWFIVGVVILGILVLIFTIVGVELTIIWNDLEPKNTLFDQPGQIYPLCIGLLVFTDGIFAIFHKIFEEKKLREAGKRNNIRSVKHVIELFLEGKKVAKQRMRIFGVRAETAGAETVEAVATP